MKTYWFYCTMCVCVFFLAFFFSLVSPRTSLPPGGLLRSKKKTTKEFFFLVLIFPLRIVRRLTGNIRPVTVRRYFRDSSSSIRLKTARRFR